MNPEQIKTEIINALDEVKNLVSDARRQKLHSIDEQLFREIESWASSKPLREALPILLANPNSSQGLQTMTLFSWWRDQLAVLTAKINVSTGATAAGVKAAWAGLAGILQPILASIHQGLWAMLSAILTVKEWAVSGDAGVHILGLAGNVKIEITFV